MSVSAQAVYENDGWVRRLAGLIRGITREVLSVAMTFLGLTIVTFVIGRVIPIDPVLAIVGDGRRRTSMRRCALEIGLDLPLPCSILHYLGRCWQGDFGRSLSLPRSRC